MCTWKLFFGIGIGIAVAVGVTAFVIISALAGGKELSKYIPLARADVMSFMEEEGFQEYIEDLMYGNDGISIILNERGNISEIVIDSPEYSLYGMKVGDEFTREGDGKQLAEHSYGYLNEDSDTIYYGVMSGRNTPGGDRVIGIRLDGTGVITEITFMSDMDANLNRKI